MALQVTQAPTQPPLRVGTAPTPPPLRVAPPQAPAPVRVAPPVAQPRLGVTQVPSAPPLAVQPPPVASGPSGSIADLGALVKSKYPGAYDDLPDEELGALVQQKYPEAYSDYGATPQAPEPEKVGFLQGVARGIVNPLLRAGATVGAGIQSLGAKTYDETKAESFTLPYLGEIKPAQSPLDGVGIAAESAANLLGGGGAVAVGKSLAKNAVGTAIKTGVKLGAKAGALTGFGSALQEDSKTVGSVAGNTLSGLLLGGVFGAAIPAAGGLLRNATRVAKTPDYLVKLSRNIEQESLRLTPVQKQNLGSRLQGITEWLSEKKITGNPEVRFEKVDSIYNDMEGQLQDFLTTAKRPTLSGKTQPLQVNKQLLLPQLEKLKKQFRNDADVLDIEKQIDRAVTTLKTKYSSGIPLHRLNELKRSTYKNAFNTAGTKVRDDVEYAIGDLYKTVIEKATKGQTINGLSIDDFNREYGTVVQARRLLKIAQSRNQVGLVGRIVSTMAGASIGSVLGPLGGAAGATAGNLVGEQVAGTAARSLVGSGLRRIGKRLGGK